jgi:hypothetical protein
MAFVVIGLMLTAFFTSHYLNQIASSEQRATVLSFKGLAFNLAYGIIGILFALLIQELRSSVQEQQSSWPAELIGNEAFRRSFDWLPWYGALLTAAVALYCLYRLRNSDSHHTLSAPPS